MGCRQKRPPGGGPRQPSQKTWVTVAKNTTDAENTPYRCKKHGQPSQKTCPPTRTVAKNTRHRCKKHLPREPSQKTRKLATVAKKHELPTQKTRNPIWTCSGKWALLREFYSLFQALLWFMIANFIQPKKMIPLTFTNKSGNLHGMSP